MDTLGQSGYPNFKSGRPFVDIYQLEKVVSLIQAQNQNPIVDDELLTLLSIFRTLKKNQEENDRDYDSLLSTVLNIGKAHNELEQRFNALERRIRHNAPNLLE